MPTKPRRPRDARGGRPSPRARAGRRPSGAQLALAAGAAVLAVAALIAIGNAQAAPPPLASALRSSGSVLGPDTAPVTIEEFADFQCPACRSFATSTEPQLRSAYVTPGKVRVVFRHYPFLGQESVWAAEAAECASEQGRFWDFHDKVYASQRGENTGTFSKANLKQLASGMGLGSSFAACLDSDKYLQRVKDDLAAGQAKGVNATPTFFINGAKIEGAMSFDQLRAKIDPLLK